MAPAENPIDDYLARLPVETDEARFLRSVPWVLDVGRQDAEGLMRDLRDEAPRLATLRRRPVFSLLTPMYNTPPRLLRELILSVRCQSWPHWELILVDDGSPKTDHLDTAREWANRDPRIKLFECAENRGISGARNHAIAQASGDFFAVLDHDDILHPMALGQFARVVNDDPEVNVVHSNECQIDDAGTRTYGYFYKPYFDLFTLLRANYVCHFTAIRRDLLMAARRGERVFRTEYDGAEDHDLFARVAMTGRMKARHVPLFLYYWRAVPTSCSTSLDAKPEIPERRLLLLEELLPEVYPGAQFRIAHPDVSRSECHLTIRLQAIEGLDRRPTALAVIPYQDDTTRLLKTLDALEKQRHDLDLTVVLSGAEPREPGTEETVSEWLARPRVHRYERRRDEVHHPARQINASVAEFGAGRDLLLTLAPGMELRSLTALQTMAMQLLADPGCGVVGLKHLGPDGRSVRHAGFKVSDASDGSGYPAVVPIRLLREYLHDEHVVLGVGLGCAMTRRETFEAVGGLDEVMLWGAYRDVDFCAKAIEHGLRNYYFGTLAACDHAPDTAECPPNREFELSALHERHARVLASWRLRMLVHAVEPLWPRADAGEPRVIVVHADPGPKPVRYKVADKLNSGLKRTLGPVHGLLKRGLTGSWRAAKRLRPEREPQTAAGTIYRPSLFRRRSRANRDS